MPLLFFCYNHELKIFLDITDTNAESSEPIQPDVTSASLAISSLQMEATTKKVLYLFHHLFFYKLIQIS